MTILIENRPVSLLPDSVAEIYSRFPHLEAEAKKLVLKPLNVIDKPERVLYVTQKEYAVLKSDDPNISIMGTDDATTCHIVIMINRNESSACLAHVDSCDNLDRLTRMVLDILGHQNEGSDSHLELSILGGYRDEQHKSELLTVDLLQFYHQLPVKFQLQSLCVGAVNTRCADGINWPIIYGATVDLHSDFAICPAKFSLDVRGPCLSLRSSRFLSNRCSLHR